MAVEDTLAVLAAIETIVTFSDADPCSASTRTFLKLNPDQIALLATIAKQAEEAYQAEFQKHHRASSEKLTEWAHDQMRSRQIPEESYQMRNH